MDQKKFVFGHFSHSENQPFRAGNGKLVCAFGRYEQFVTSLLTSLNCRFFLKNDNANRRFGNSVPLEDCII